MKFTAAPLAGAYLIEIEPASDDRGFFARTWCTREFTALELEAQWVQCSISFNRKQGTLRGMHYQCSPAAEAKLVRCTQGAVYDVLADIRPESPTYRHWVAYELSAGDRRSVYIPPGFAHGFLTLTDDVELHYSISEFYRPEMASGFRWNDSSFGIQWPDRPTVISQRDESYPDFES